MARSASFDQDLNRARELLTEAGFPEGRGFPIVHLLVNRNEPQNRVAQAIAAMWRANLNLETEIVVRNWDDYETALRTGDYDLARRGSVMQTPDELTNVAMMFRSEPGPTKAEAAPVSPASSGRTQSLESAGAKPGIAAADPRPASPVESEAEALRQVRAIPIYFASSSSLVKPYVVGFDVNVLDAPFLKRVRIDTNWREQPQAR